MTYDELLLRADETGLIVKEKPLINNNGRIKGNRIAIRKSIPTTVEKSCVLAEEIGHYYTSTGDIINQESVSNRKQEQRAVGYGYNLKIGLMGLIRAYEHGCRNRHEIAEYLDVTDKYLNDAVDYYKSKYGLFTTLDNYVIYFIPSLSVIKLMG